MIKMKKLKLSIEECNDFGPNKKCLFINVDQTPVYFDMVQRNTYHKKGGKRIIIKNTRGEKKRVTINIEITSEGQKLPLFIVYKQSKGKIVNSFPNDIFIRNNKNGWMNNDLVVEWLQKIIFKIKFKENQIPILLWDSFRSHMSQEVKQVIDKFQEKQTFLVEFIPPCTTSLLQPLDVSFNKSYKQKIRLQFSSCLDDKGLSQQNISKKGYFKSPTNQQIQQWAQIAFQEMKSDLIINSFKHCGINLSINNNENHMINSNISGKEKIIESLKNILIQKKRKIIELEDDDYLDCQNIQEQLKYMESEKELIEIEKANNYDLSIDEQEFQMKYKENSQQFKPESEEYLSSESNNHSSENEYQKELLNVDIEMQFNSKKLKCKDEPIREIKFIEDIFEDEKQNIVDQKIQIIRKKPKIITNTNLITKHFLQQ